MQPTPTAVDINAEAERIGATPELLTTNGQTGDKCLRLWRVGGAEVIETNGDSIWDDDSDFADFAKANGLWLAK